MKKVCTLFLVLAIALAFSCTRKCADADTTGTEIWLGKTRIIAPSAFTPNNQDGVNDTYSFIEIKPSTDTSQQSGAAINIKDFRLQVNKSGELIFETYTWGGSWNGKNPKGKKVEGLVDVEYSISDVDGNISEGKFNLFVVPSGCLQDCMQKHIFGDMIDTHEGVVKETKETFCP